jgi:hypothetical protein
MLEYVFTASGTGQTVSAAFRFGGEVGTKLIQNLLDPVSYSHENLKVIL